MDQIISVKYEEKPCYDIVLSETFESLFEHFSDFDTKDKKVCIVTDSNVAKIYKDTLNTLLGSKCKILIFFEFAAGEKSKNTQTVGELYEVLINNRFDRRDLLVALGGGVVGDMTGFAAATYLRGIDFIQIPTTLLSQVDSSIGGKTGVDHLQYKNVVGAFYMPRLVYMNLSVLRTLPPEQFASGMGEVIKHGLIRDAAYYESLKTERAAIRAFDPEALRRMVGTSCQIKRAVVERDPKEKGERALLNFGHTIGHAVEKLTDFSMYHGECVAVGMVAAAYLSMKRGYLTAAALADIEETLRAYELPVRLSPDRAPKPEAILAATKNDKKMAGDKIKFILLREIGDAVIDMTLTDQELLEGIGYILP